MKAFDRIVADTSILGGKPCIKGTRLSVEFILELFSQGASQKEILQTYPYLQAEDLRQALLYAQQFLQNEVVTVLEDAS